MSAVISGTNGLLQAYDYQVLTTAFSYTFAAGTQVLVIDPAGTLATGTITMPASPADGMTITVESTQQVTALTMSGNGGTVVGPAVQLIPNQPLSWVYRTSNTSWYPLWGGAGRATALVSGTAVASTSGTSIDFTGIPSWVKRITVMLSGVSTNGTSTLTLQLGDSGGIETSGYAGGCLQNGTQTAWASSAMLLNRTGAAVQVNTTQAILTLLGSNQWVLISTVYSNESASIYMGVSSGTKTLSDTLDRLRITTTSGTDTFDAGSVNILYE